MTARSLHLAINETVNHVPVNEFIGDSFAANRIIRHEIINGLIRKHDAPTKSIISLIALVYIDLMFGIVELH